MLKTGSDDWWQSLSGPQSEASGDAYRVDVLVAGPGGQRGHLGDAAGVDLYHRRHRPPQNAVPQTLRRVPGTDAWQWQTTLSPTWRGSYCFIPSERDDDFSPRFLTATRRTALCCARLATPAAARGSPIRSMCKAGRAGAATRSRRWSCLRRRSSPAGRCAMNAMPRRSAFSGAARGLATAVGYGFMPPATARQKSARWRCCWTASFWAESMPGMVAAGRTDPRGPAAGGGVSADRRYR
nr:enterobactin esterase [Raoultella sp. NCTC 9187]